MSVNPSQLPTQFGPYHLKQKIASGGMAEIYLAETSGPGGFKKPLVIKMIHHAYSDDKRFLAMFTEEAKILSSLTHGNIVPIFDFGTAHGLLYLAMEFIDGVDVATLMDICRTKGISLPMETALFIGIGTAAGLSHAHQAGDRGVVHRDVSPQNILLSRSGEVKLCDFGLATYSLEEISNNDAIKGKLRYLSPEQARGEPVDGRSDLFSLGVVLYELIAGHHPVPSGSGVTVLQELAGGYGYPPLNNVAPWVPEAIAEIVDKSIAFDKDKRFRTGEEMRSALSRRLYEDFPAFTPTVMAELVIRVQTEEEQSSPSPGADSDSFFRARIASFASTTRERQSAVNRQEKEVRYKLLVLSISAIIVGLGIFSGWFIIHDGATGGAQGQKKETSFVKEERAFNAVPATDSDVGNASDVHSSDEKRVDTSLAKEVSPPDMPPKESKKERPVKSTKVASKGVEAAAKTAKATGIVNINASPWADVSIDGVEYTTTPILGLTLKAGKHKAVFVNPELGITKTRTFVVKADEPTTVVVEME